MKLHHIFISLKEVFILKYEIDTHLFSQKLSSLLRQKNMIDKKGKPDKIALYNLLNPTDVLTEDDCRTDRQYVTDKTRNISNWLRRLLSYSLQSVQYQDYHSGIRLL